MTGNEIEKCAMATELKRHSPEDCGKWVHVRCRVVMIAGREVAVVGQSMLQILSHLETLCESAKGPTGRCQAQVKSLKLTLYVHMAWPIALYVRSDAFSAAV